MARSASAKSAAPIYRLRRAGGGYQASDSLQQDAYPRGATGFQSAWGPTYFTTCPSAAATLTSISSASVRATRISASRDARMSAKLISVRS
jgi:hypothetical protein